MLSYSHSQLTVHLYVVVVARVESSGTEPGSTSSSRQRRQTRPHQPAHAPGQRAPQPSNSTGYSRDVLGAAASALGRSPAGQPDDDEGSRSHGRRLHDDEKRVWCAGDGDTKRPPRRSHDDEDVRSQAASDDERGTPRRASHENECTRGAYDDEGVRPPRIDDDGCGRARWRGNDAESGRRLGAAAATTGPDGGAPVCERRAVGECRAVAAAAGAGGQLRAAARRHLAAAFLSRSVPGQRRSWWSHDRAQRCAEKLPDAARCSGHVVVPE